MTTETAPTTPAAPPLPPAPNLIDLLMHTADAVQQLLDSRILCFGCIADAHRAAANGTPEDQIQRPNVANLIVDGRGQCFNHVQFTDRPLLPGQSPSGLFLPGQGV